MLFLLVVNLFFVIISKYLALFFFRKKSCLKWKRSIYSVRPLGTQLQVRNIQLEGFFSRIMYYVLTGYLFSRNFSDFWVFSVKIESDIQPYNQC